MMVDAKGIHHHATCTENLTPSTPPLYSLWRISPVLGVINFKIPERPVLVVRIFEVNDNDEMGNYT